MLIYIPRNYPRKNPRKLICNASMKNLYILYRTVNFKMFLYVNQMQGHYIFTVITHSLKTIL